MRIVILFTLPLWANFCNSWGNFWSGPTLRFSSANYAFAQNRPISTVRPEISTDLNSCEISPGLPQGLSFNAATCAITGTPTGSLQASLPYSVSAKGHGGITTVAISIRISGTTAARVYGQNGSFTSGGAGTSATQLSIPFQATAISSGVLICDQLNHRVLSFPGDATTATGVYGQGGSLTSATVNNGGVSAGLNSPAGVVSDGSGIYVTDTTNHRVLYFGGTSPTPSRVYGQGGNFSGNTQNFGSISANSLSNPRSVVVASDGIYIADGGNNRVLFFPGTSTTATRVYGQAGNFTVGAPSLTQDGLNGPRSAAVDATGVYISDQGNQRVLFYSGTSTTAARVYGQPDFVSGAATVSTTGLSSPAGLALVENGLYVSDFGNNRLLYYAGTSVTASAVYGQLGSFVSGGLNAGGLSANSLSGPMMVTAADDGIYIADMNNNRVLVY